MAAFASQPPAAAPEPVVSDPPRSAKPLTIVHYLPEIRLELGGVVRAVLDWCSVFAARGHRVWLFTSDGADLPPTWINSPATNGQPRAVVLPPAAVGRFTLSSSALALLDPVIAQADLLHLHAPWLPGNRALARLARRHGVPYGVTIHGMLDDWSMSQRRLKKQLYLTLLGRSFLHRAAWVHCTAQAELEQARRWYANPHSVVLPYLIDLTAFAHLPGRELGLSLLPSELRDQPKILFLSRLHEKKGLDLLMRAAAQLRDEGLSFVLLIAGSGEAAYEAQLRQLVGQLQLDHRVCFLGLIKGEAKISLYQAADLFVLPTHQENFGLVLVESLACGTPIITTRGTDIWKEMASAGGVVSALQPDALAAAMRQLLALPTPQRTDLGRRGREWVFEHYNMDHLASGYEQLYRSSVSHP